MQEPAATDTGIDRPLSARTDDDNWNVLLCGTNRGRKQVCLTQPHRPHRHLRNAADAIIGVCHEYSSRLMPWPDNPQTARLSMLLNVTHAEVAL